MKNPTKTDEHKQAQAGNGLNSVTVHRNGKAWANYGSRLLRFKDVADLADWIDGNLAAAAQLASSQTTLRTEGSVQ